MSIYMKIIISIACVVAVYILSSGFARFITDEKRIKGKVNKAKLIKVNINLGMYKELCIPYVMFSFLSILLFIIAGAIEYDCNYEYQQMIAGIACVATVVIVIRIIFRLYTKILNFMQEVETLSCVKHLIAIIFLTLIEVFGFTYSVINSLFCDSFIGLNGTQFEENYLEFQYFSVMTFSTVGYGDITPVGMLAMLVTMVEAVIVLFMISLGSIMFFTARKNKVQ